MLHESAQVPTMSPHERIWNKNDPFFTRTHVRPNSHYMLVANTCDEPANVKLVIDGKYISRLSLRVRPCNALMVMQISMQWRWCFLGLGDGNWQRKLYRIHAGCEWPGACEFLQREQCVNEFVFDANWLLLDTQESCGACMRRPQLRIHSCTLCALDVLRINAPTFVHQV